MKTVNLDLSKQLKEAGYPQKSFFSWSWYGNRNYPDWEVIPKWGNESEYAAPLADEILEQLPCATQQEWFVISKNPSKEEWVIDWNTKNEMFKGDTLADAAAKMWLYLKKEGLI